MIPSRPLTTTTGLSSRRRLPRLGKIRLGIRQASRSGTPAPFETPFFVCPPEVRKIYGDQPTSLPILLPAEDLGTLFPQALACYGKTTGLKCRGNNEIAMRRWADVEPTLQATLGGSHGPHDYVEIPCPCPRLETGECSPVGSLLILLPHVSLGGVYQIDTHSRANIIRINSAVDWLKMMLGHISMIPLTLLREPVPMGHNGTQRIHYLLSLRFDGDLEAARRVREHGAHAMLPAFALPTPHTLHSDITPDDTAPPPGTLAVSGTVESAPSRDLPVVPDPLLLCQPTPSAPTGVSAPAAQE
jgi:hypothetical protein